MPGDQEPLLGLASTEELLREVVTRLRHSLGVFGEPRTEQQVEWIMTLAEMLGEMDAPAKEYRTVDGD